jgi:uncharacterized protein YbjT (DUF2867 family)
MILVTGATGTTGGAVARQLIAAGLKPRLLLRSPEKAKAFEGKAELFKGDLSDKASVEKALAGVEKLYLVTAGVDGPAQEAVAIAAAKAAGVKHVVLLSVIGAEYEAITFGRWHRASERLLEASGLQWTFLRPGNFTTNTYWWVDTIKSQGAVYAPLGDGKYAPIDPEDIAAVAVASLTKPGHEGKAYTLTGPRALSTAEMVAIVAKESGRAIKYVDVPPSAAQDGMLKMGMPAAYVDALLELYAFMKSGGAAMTTNTVQDLLGRPAVTFEQWTAKHAGVFK